MFSERRTHGGEEAQRKEAGGIPAEKRAIRMIVVATGGTETGGKIESSERHLEILMKVRKALTYRLHDKDSA